MKTESDRESDRLYKARINDGLKLQMAIEKNNVVIEYFVRDTERTREQVIEALQAGMTQGRATTHDITVIRAPMFLAVRRDGDLASDVATLNYWQLRDAGWDCLMYF